MSKSVVLTSRYKLLLESFTEPASQSRVCPEVLHKAENKSEARHASSLSPNTIQMLHACVDVPESGADGRAGQAAYRVDEQVCHHNTAEHPWLLCSLTVRQAEGSCAHPSGTSFP